MSFESLITFTVKAHLPSGYADAVRLKLLSYVGVSQNIVYVHQPQQYLYGYDDGGIPGEVGSSMNLEPSVECFIKKLVILTKA